MKKGIVAIIAIIGLVYLLSLRATWPKPSMGETCKSLPRFEDYLVESRGGVIGVIDLDNNKMAKEEMEAELLSATGSAVNFAGKYTIVNHECGLGCQKHAVIDQVTSKIIFYGLQTDKLLKSRVNSSLVIADKRYYEFKDNQMNYLCEDDKK
ncbi:hypothetical protein HZB69_01325 [Candidatus Amesbacteria bacterium]|nr:hypothetical protein [Candidatus Amesbacteria bacterium]